ncbi:hypothetical protein V6N13_092356 [Hibiscus sabdariffa]
MECKKFALLLVAMAVVLLAAAAPTATAARHGVLPFSIITNTNIRNPFADIFVVGKPAEKCVPYREICDGSVPCCIGACLTVPIDPPVPAYCV